MPDFEKNSHCCSSGEYITLFDVCRKLVEYKKTFWIIFFVVFAVGSSIVYFKKPKYRFTQVFEVGRYVNSRGDVSLLIEEDSRKMEMTRENILVGIITKIYLPKIIDRYNLKSNEKINVSSYRINVKAIGEGKFILSAVAGIKEKGIYKFIFNESVKGLVKEYEEIIDFRRKSIINLRNKLNIMLSRKQDLNDSMKKNVGYVKKLGDGSKFFMEMYLYGSLEAERLLERIGELGLQLELNYNTRMITDFIVSDKSSGLSKLFLMILVFMFSVFAAFFGVVVMNSLNSFRVLTGRCK